MVGHRARVHVIEYSCNLPPTGTDRVDLYYDRCVALFNVVAQGAGDCSLVSGWNVDFATCRGCAVGAVGREIIGLGADKWRANDHWIVWGR